MISIRNFPIAFLLVFAFAGILSGCVGIATIEPNFQPSDQDDSKHPSSTEETPAQLDRELTETPVIETPDGLEHRSTQTLPTGLERVETPQAEPVTGEVPAEILAEIFADLSKRTGSAPEDVQVVRAEAVVWNDGALGCPKPGEFYIQMMINGYWVVLQVDGTDYDYRVSDKGYFTLCENPSLGPPDTSPLADK